MCHKNKIQIVFSSVEESVSRRRQRLDHSDKPYDNQMNAKVKIIKSRWRRDEVFKGLRGEYEEMIRVR